MPLMIEADDASTAIIVLLSSIRQPIITDASSLSSHYNYTHSKCRLFTYQVPDLSSAQIRVPDPENLKTDSASKVS